MFTFLALPFSVAARPASFGFIEGRYVYGHNVTTEDNREIYTEDSVTFTRSGSDGYDFQLFLHADYGYSCTLSGNAPITSPSGATTLRLAYRQAEKEAIGTRACQIDIEITQDTITFSDPKYTCNAVCGLSSTINGTQFFRKTREAL